MALDDEGEEERPNIDPPPSPDDRLWRHPSEIASGTPLPSAWPTPPPSRPSRRAAEVVALAGACLTGAVVAVGIMWLTRPTHVIIREVSATSTPATARFSRGDVSSQALARSLAPSLVVVSASHSDQWTTGTGLWLDHDGTIVVATPVIDGADQVIAASPDGTQVAAKVLASDAATGITVLTVDDAVGSPITSATGTPQAGEKVVVIGAESPSANGQAHQRVVTASISAVDVRTSVASSADGDPIVLHDALQLDRPLPADVLGGVAVDNKGNILGIVLATADSEDLAVLIPGSEALAAARGLRDDGEVRRAWLGVRAVDVSPAAAAMLGIAGGAKLTVVDPDSPASAGGMAVGDVVVDVDGHHINDASDLVVALRTWKPGERVTITWHRGADTSSADVMLGG